MATETNRALIPFTNEHFIVFCEKMLGQPYWYKCTESLRARKAKQYPAHYGSSRTARYRKDIEAKKVAADCVGGCKGYAWTNGGVGVIESIGTDKTFTSKYGANGCPDKSANGMFSYAKSKGMDWGKIDALPEIVGLALHKDGHIGYYAGNGYAIEWRGFNYGCVKTKVSDRKWTHWYKLPFINYDVAADDRPEDTPSASAALKKGASGEAVRTVQERLIRLGYSLPRYGVDGDFGAETEAAVKAFQKDTNLEVDGIVGEKTRAALEKALANGSDGDGEGATGVETPSDADESPEGEAQTGGEPESDSEKGAEEGPDKGSCTMTGSVNADDSTDDEDSAEPEPVSVRDYGTRLLRYRSGHAYLTGDDVAAVQGRLAELGFDPGDVDGIYGPNTATAVTAFQKAAGIETDGIVGPITRAELEKGLPDAPAGDGSSAANVSGAASNGNNGDDA